MMFASKNRLTEVRKVANTLKNNNMVGPEDVWKASKIN
jgi:hypothetical protein